MYLSVHGPSSLYVQLYQLSRKSGQDCQTGSWWPTNLWKKNKQPSRSLTWFSLHCWNLKLWTKFIDIHRSLASKENNNESLLEGLPHLLHVFPLWTFQPSERNPSNEPCQASNEAAPLLCFGIIHVMLGNRNQETFDHLEAKPQKNATSDVQVTNRVYKQEYVATNDRNSFEQKQQISRRFQMFKFKCWIFQIAKQNPRFWSWTTRYLFKIMPPFVYGWIANLPKKACFCRYRYLLPFQVRVLLNTWERL